MSGIRNGLEVVLTKGCSIGQSSGGQSSGGQSSGGQSSGGQSSGVNSGDIIPRIIPNSKSAIINRELLK